MTCRIDTGLYASLTERTWNMLDLVSGVDGVQTSLANPEAGGFLVPTSETAVGMVQGITEDVLWRFVQSPQQSFQIVPVDNPGKCLANVAGNVELVTVSSSFAETTQYWYLTENENGYIIENVANHSKLTASSQNGTLTCTLSEEEQVWTFLDYNVPTEVSMLSSLANPTLYLKNASGKNYDDEPISVGSDEREDAIVDLEEYLEYCNTHTVAAKEKDRVKDGYLAKIYGDMCAFCIVYDEEQIAYRIMPISSGNGKHRAIAKSSSGNGIVLLDNTASSVDTSRILFVIELQSDGAYVIKLQSTLDDEDRDVLVLTDNGSGENVILTTLSETGTVLSSQKWTFDTYECILPDGSMVIYSDMENYYSSLGFSSPFGQNGRSLVVTSDFGVRLSSNDFHKGLDLRTLGSISLYTPYSGTVAKVQSTVTSSAGLYVMIKLDCEAYMGESLEYELYVVYMHMNSIEVAEGQFLTAGEKVGMSGKTGDGITEHHLHYGVFLMPKNATRNQLDANKNPLNPLLFFTPAEFDNG